LWADKPQRGSLITTLKSHFILHVANSCARARSLSDPSPDVDGCINSSGSLLVSEKTALTGYNSYSTLVYQRERPPLAARFR
jgi:hypothetical protein